MDTLEVAITSDTTGQQWSSAAWNAKTGTCIMSYKGGGVATPRTLCMIGQDYIASVERTKPILHVWPLNSHERIQGVRFVFPGRPTALAFSPNGKYCVAGIDEKLYIWQMSSGSLLNILSRHYQTITNIKFCDDGSHFVSAGDDGIVLVWTLHDIIFDPSVNAITQSNTDPLYVFSDHSLPVKDLHIGKGGMRSRLVTVSIDRTCKIYDLSTGELLLNLVFDKSLSAVTMDSVEMNVYVGTTDGDIFQYSIVNPPRMREFHVGRTETSQIFVGHSKTVNCLSVSVDGKTLLSGSNDNNLMIWHIPSGQKTLSIPHRGPVVNAFMTIVPKNMFATIFNPSVLPHALQRNVNFSNNIEVITKETNSFWSTENEFTEKDYVLDIEPPVANTETIDKLKKEINKLKDINRKLYQFSVDNILQGIKNKN